MTVREEKISLRLWNHFKRANQGYADEYAIIFGSLGKVLSAFQRGVADYLAISEENRIAYNSLELLALNSAYESGEERVIIEYTYKENHFYYLDCMLGGE